MKRSSHRRPHTSMDAHTSPPRAIALAAGLILAAGMGPAPASATVVHSPIPAKYHNDLGIADDPDVIFFDDFESWKENGTQPPPGKWSMRKNKISLTQAVKGKIAADGSAGPGRNVLKIACWTEGRGSQAGGLNLKLGN